MYTVKSYTISRCFTKICLRPLNKLSDWEVGKLREILLCLSGRLLVSEL
jgi:hypothetical protein